MKEESPRIRHVIGCMTGTSLDGLDAALVRLTGTGLDMTAEFIGMINAPLPNTLRTTLLSMANGEAHPPLEFMRAARYLGVVHAEACAELISKHARPGSAVADAGGVDFIVAHGQTIWHAPADRLSWQLFDPWPIVRTLNLPVCYDLRQADLVAGGQGAPITPIADWVMYREAAKGTINLGGICNVSRWVGDQPLITEIWGEDICPCNILIDGLVARLFPENQFDKDGKLSGSTSPVSGVTDLINQGVIAVIRSEKSLGREHFGDEWFGQLLEILGGEISSHAVLSSAIQYVANHIAMSVEMWDGSKPIVLAGGGINNKTLLLRLHELKVPVIASDDLGIPAEAREAMGFAVLGVLSADGVPITLPKVTGSESPGVAGVWAYPQGPPR